MSIKQLILSRNNRQAWFSSSFPYYMDIDLGTACKVHGVRVIGADARRASVRLYGSRDDLMFNHLKDDKPVRWVRIQIVDAAASPAQWCDRVELDYSETDDICSPAEDPIDNIANWHDTAYAEPVSAADTETYLSGMVQRLLGEAYVPQLHFRLVEHAQEMYRVFNDNGRIMIEGTTGVSLAAGLNAYLCTCCHAHIAEQDQQVQLPDVLPLPGETLSAVAADRVRYANNYCTLSYTMPYWGKAEWQRELDWLALCGVNVVLDFTGMEAVWYRFLRQLGCKDQEIGQFIVGPCYTAWQLMQNIEGIGGPVNRQFIADRLELARHNQHIMRVLGMQPVRQGYAGMLPACCDQYVMDATLFPQGKWCGIDRPSMLDPSSARFREIAALFYRCQSQLLGDQAHYYAIDPYHEGGNRPENMTDDVAAQCILNALLTADHHGIWMVQAWRENPSRALLQGIAGHRSHVIILDLSATDNPLHGDDEFMGTDWIYCMLDMYGGRRSVHGDLGALSSDIPATRKKAKHMIGIGTTAEATFHNPVAFDLLFDMGWNHQPVQLQQWIDAYAQRRYGILTPEIHAAWMLLLETAYHDPGYSHHGGYTQIFNYRPQITMHPGPVINELNCDVIKPPYYDVNRFARAVLLMMKAYENGCRASCFIYDLQDLLRQLLNHFGTASALKSLRYAMDGNASAFDEETTRFLSLLDACDRVMRLRADTLLDHWSSRAMRAGQQYDDQSADLFAMDARALITTWGYRETYTKLLDYAYRQYGGLLGTFCRERWVMWFEHLRHAMTGDAPVENIGTDEWFAHDWSFVMNGCTSEQDAAPLNVDEVLPQVFSLVRSCIGKTDGA